MAFSFNWAGMSVPQVNAYDGTENAMRDASNAALAARGFEKREADREYADILNGYEGPSTDRGPEYRAMQQELASLKARNAEIARRLGIGY